MYYKKKNINIKNKIINKKKVVQLKIIDEKDEKIEK